MKKQQVIVLQDKLANAEAELALAKQQISSLTSKLSGNYLAQFRTIETLFSNEAFVSFFISCFSVNPYIFFIQIPAFN